MTTSQVTKSHTKKYELTHFARYSLVSFCDLGRISSVGLAQAFMVATSILSLRLRIAETGHLAVFHQNLSNYLNKLTKILQFQKTNNARLVFSRRIDWHY